MADKAKETLQLIAEHLLVALHPLVDAVSDLSSLQSFLYALGWDVEELTQPYIELGGSVQSALKVLERDPSPEMILSVLAEIEKLYKAIDGLPRLEGIASSQEAQFLKELPYAVFEHLLIRYLSHASPAAYSLLETLGIIGAEWIPAGDNRPGTFKPRLFLEEIPALLKDPLSVGERVYGWGTADLDFERLALHLSELLWAMGVPAHLARPQEDEVEGYFAAITDAGEMDLALRIPLPFLGPGGAWVYDVGLDLLELPGMPGKDPASTVDAGLILQPALPPASLRKVKIRLAPATWLEIDATITTDSSSDPLFGILIRPSEIAVKLPGAAGAATPKLHLAASLGYEPKEPRVLLGHPKESRLQMKAISLGLLVDTHPQGLDLGFQLAIKELAGVISTAKLDGFFKSLFGGSDLAVQVPFELAWSKRKGLTFQGGAGLEIATHPHLALGPVTITGFEARLHSSLGTKTPDLRLSAGIDLDAKLGPLAVSTQGIGVYVNMAFERGNAGPFQIDGGFKPPAGLGIVVDAGPVTGGGFLSFDHENGRYAGVLQLQIYEIGLKAIGLLDTKLPGGEKGFSFLIIITAEFSPIQLGFGFTLNGVGGLAGIHRTIVTKEIQSGIRTGAIDHILFPDNPVANATRLISDLRRIFPPAKDRYVFGPMAIIGWGTPTLIEAEVGIIIELPQPVTIVILGELSAHLPDKKSPIVELHISVLGILDFGRKLLSIDASLHDSRILAFTIYGDMALRLSWGTPPGFAFSLGGLNPHFQPPAGFPKLRRLTIALGKADSPRISLQAYMALTSNTIQFGARAELFADAGFMGLNVYGFAGFDVLINFSPFSFIADIGAMIAVRTGTTVLFGIRLEGSLTGPAPWRIKGQAVITIVVPIPFHFDVQFGSPQRAKPLPRQDPWGVLQKAIAEKRHWQTRPPPSGRQPISLAQSNGGEASSLLDPLGEAVLRQKAVPLNRPITLFSHAKPRGPGRYQVSSVSIGGTKVPGWEPVRDYFAPAQFEDLSDAQKLSRPSFEKMDAGVAVGSGAIAAGPHETVDLEYETVVVTAPWQTTKSSRYKPPSRVQEGMVKVGASARSQLKATGHEKYVDRSDPGPAVSLADELFVIVTTADQRLANVQGNEPAAKGAAFQTLANLETADPSARGCYQVVPVHEVEAGT